MPRHVTIPYLAFAAALVLAPAFAACGGGAGGKGPASPTASALPSAKVLPPASAAPDAGAPASGAASAAPGPMKPIMASAMEAQLKELGLDPKAMPPLNKIERPKLMKVMQTFQKALGITCNGCHDGNDFRAWTPKKKIAGKMWDEFVRKLAMEDGGALYCDSCHGGRVEFLDSHDKKALAQWMDTNFVSKLKRIDKKDLGCDTCHGDPFEGHFLAGWSK